MMTNSLSTNSLHNTPAFAYPSKTTKFISSLQMSSGFAVGSTKKGSIGKPNAKGMGKGMGKGISKPKKKNANKNGGEVVTAFDVSAALLRSEKLYDKLCLDSTKALLREQDEEDEDDNDDSSSVSDSTINTEYMITARYKPGSKPLPGSASLSDWIPVAQLCMLRSISSSDMTCHQLQTAISSYCREIYHAAVLTAPVFASVPRNSIEYGAEPLDSFSRYVFEEVIEGRRNGSNGENHEEGIKFMTKAQARRTLGLEEDCNDVAKIKMAYRTLSFQLHPDRFAGTERSEKETKKTNEEFASVKLAYETLCSGVRNNTTGGVSWYESLGGRARTDFEGPIKLLSTGEARMRMENDVSSLGGLQSAVVGVDPDMMAFVARNQAAASSI